MIQDVTLRVKPRESADNKILKSLVSRSLGIPAGDINDLRVIRRSIDARQRVVMLNLTMRVATGDDMKVEAEFTPVDFHTLRPDAEQVVIVGAGPAGLFAALKAIELGVKPILLERGRDVDSRREDIAMMSRLKKVNPVSNYCFGEGGAGAFSDGKLFTRSKKRGNVTGVLQLLCQHGASHDILIDSHPHIGSDRLPKIIRNIRQTIIDCGGEVHFDTCVERLLIENNQVTGVETFDGKQFHGPVVLAIGHSAHDTIMNLHSQGVGMEAKGFAVGVRLEHPQELIDRLQYHDEKGRGKFLPAAEYNFVTQVDGRGVYSFCMCPGGVIVPSASAEGENLVNGMSASARAGQWANSGMVVEIRPGDFPKYEKYGEMQLLKLQADLEYNAWTHAGGGIMAAAQRMTDFTEGQKSTTTLPTSYAPGVYPADMREILPPFIAERLRKGFMDFDRKCKGFLSDKAQLIGMESRTSSPVRIPRDKETMEHETLGGLYPVGEGAGYAGGIVSAAIDGQRAMENLIKKRWQTL